MNFRFESVQAINVKLDGVENIPGAIYAIKFGPTVFGWVAKNKEGQWVAWNNHGDFWVSYTSSRLATAQKMFDAPWREFIRPRKIEV